MFLVSLGLGVLLARFGRGRACILIPLVLAVVASAGRLALAGELTWIEPALWLLQGVAYFVVGWSVWGLAGIVSDTRQAKRFFPLIGAGGVLGYVVGGLVTQPLASTIGTENLILVWVATLVVVVLLGAKLLSIGDPARRRPGRDGVGDPIEQLRQGLRYVRRSALMRWMALGAILFSLLFFSLYLPFSRAATARFPDPDDLAGFFGLFFGISTGLAFLLSMFVTNRLLSRFGVPTVMLVLPLLYVARLRGAHDRLELRGARRLPVRPGRLALRRGEQRLGSRDQHGAGRSPGPDPRLPLRRTDAGRHGARRRGRPDRGTRPVAGRALGDRVGRRAARHGGDARRAPRVPAGARAGAPGGSAERLRCPTRRTRSVRARGRGLIGDRRGDRRPRRPRRSRPPRLGPRPGGRRGTRGGASAGGVAARRRPGGAGDIRAIAGEGRIRGLRGADPGAVHRPGRRSCGSRRSRRWARSACRRRPPPTPWAR